MRNEDLADAVGVRRGGGGVDGLAVHRFPEGRASISAASRLCCACGLDVGVWLAVGGGPMPQRSHFPRRRRRRRAREDCGVCLVLPLDFDGGGRLVMV